MIQDSLATDPGEVLQSRLQGDGLDNRTSTGLEAMREIGGCKACLAYRFDHVPAT